MSQPIIHPRDPVYFPTLKQESKPVKVITARIFNEGTDQIFQDVICYVYQDIEGDYDNESWRPVYYTIVEIKLPLYVKPDDVKSDIEVALDEEDISHERDITINYTLAPTDSI